mmetsp:Transcript_29094/g.52299  ORF Transcript_29094/g.52299 Transcript_29094/m.52299 type:complete len:80 (-) Transcript_29094:1430-1669(-)
MHRRSPKQSPLLQHCACLSLGRFLCSGCTCFGSHTTRAREGQQLLPLCAVHWAVEVPKRGLSWSPITPSTLPVHIQPYC